MSRRLADLPHARTPSRGHTSSVEGRLESLGKPSLSQLIEIVERVGKSDETVVFAGSLSLGLGNTKSDIDILLLNPHSTSRPGGPFQFWVDGCRVEVVRIGLDELVSQIDAVNLALTRPGRLRFPQDRLRLLSRAAFGCHVAGPAIDPDFDALLAETCHRTVIRRSEDSARHHALVASLAAEQGDHLIAAWNARGAIEARIQADLSRRGVPYAGSKWAYEQAALADLPATVRTMLDLPRSAEEWPAYTADCLAEVRPMLRAETSLPDVGRSARWDLRELSLHREGGVPVLIHLEHKVAVEIREPHETAWGLLADAPDGTPIGAESRAARDLAWKLYLRGLIDIRWPGEEIE